MWQLFYAQDPIVDPCPVIAFGDFATPLRQDGVTRCRIAIDFNPANAAVTVEQPEGQATFTQPKVNIYWGSVSAPRPAAGRAPNRYAEFTTIGSAPASGVSPVPLRGSGLHFAGDVTNSLSMPTSLHGCPVTSTSAGPGRSTLGRRTRAGGAERHRAAAYTCSLAP